MVASMNLGARATTISWYVCFRYAHDEELAEVCVEMDEMNTDVQAKRVVSTSIETRTMQTPLKRGWLSVDGQRND